MKTAVAAPAPPPSAEEILDALDRMTPAELRRFKAYFLRRFGVPTAVVQRPAAVNAVGGPQTYTRRGVG